MIKERVRVINKKLPNPVVDHDLIIPFERLDDANKEAILSLMKKEGEYDA